MTKKSTRTIIESYMSEGASEDARMNFEEWMTDGDLSKEKNEALNDIWTTWPITSISVPESPDSLIDEAEKLDYHNNKNRGRKKTILLWLTSSVAASLALLCVLMWNKVGDEELVSETCLASSHASKAEFALPDGTNVVLNKNSKLYYSGDLSSSTRLVRLIGEGYFDVAKNAEKPFIVMANDVSIEVLGTKFTVSAYEDSEVDAYLEEGSIIAKIPEQDPVILEPNYAVKYDASTKELIKFKESASNHTAWIDGKLEFVNKNLRDIIECLQHWYCVDISCDDMSRASQVRVSMTIKQEGIDEICNALSHITDMSYIIDSNGNVKISF